MLLITSFFPEALVLPPHSALAYSQNDLTTAAEKLRLTKLISHDLGFMAPDLLKLLDRSQLLEAEAMVEFSASSSRRTR